MLALTAALLMIVEPADATTMPSDVDDHLSRDRQPCHRAGDDGRRHGAMGVVPLSDVALTNLQARRLEALRRVGHSDVVGSPERAVGDVHPVLDQLTRDGLAASPRLDLVRS